MHKQPEADIVVEPVGYHYHGGERVQMHLLTPASPKDQRGVDVLVSFRCPVCNDRFDAEVHLQSGLPR